MDLLANDLRFALRTLRRQFAFTAAAVATLSLGIGATTAMFSVVESTLLKPLPFHAPNGLVFLWDVAGPDRSIRGDAFMEVLDWARLNRTFDGIAIYDETSLNLRTLEGADRIDAELVSASYFSMLGATTAIGRVFSADEDRVFDANPVVIVSDAMWATRFGRDPSIVGRTVVLNDKPFTVIGVARPGFKGLSFDTDVWLPAAMARAAGSADPSDRGARMFGAIGRIRREVPLEAAQADMDRVARQLAAQFPESNSDRGIQLFSLRDSYLGSTRSMVLAVFAAVGLLMLIACSNVVGLQLARAAGRRRELALRIALGADRGRLVQQLVVEGLVLALASAVGGLGLAYWGLDALVLLTPAGVLPAFARPSIDFAVFGFALVTAIGCGVVFGLIPALRASRDTLTDSLREGSRGAAGGLGRGARLGSRQLLVVAETAVAVVLLIGAGLYVQSLRHQLAVAPGFDAAGVLRARLTLPPSYTPEARLQFADRLRTGLANVPSVRGVAVGSDLPLSGVSSAAFVHVPGVEEAVRYYRHSVAPEFFAALGIRLLAGRAFSSDDRAGTPLVAIISASMARRFWPAGGAVGRTIRLGNVPGPEATVVGVVDDVHYRDLTTPLATTEPDIYLPLAQRSTNNIQIAVRAGRPPSALAAPLRRAIAAIDPTIPLFGVQPLESLLADQTASGRFASTMLFVFGAAALVLTAVGLYGVLAFLVTLRTREIGIRIALGATHQRVLRGVVGEGLRLVALGVAAGLGAAALATQWIATQLYSVDDHDPLVFAFVALLLLAVATAASLIPGWRAARVDPQVALRSE